MRSTPPLRRKRQNGIVLQRVTKTHRKKDEEGHGSRLKSARDTHGRKPMRVAVPGNLNRGDEQDQLPETATRADQDQLPETATRADTTHRSSRGVNRRSDESDKKGEVHCEVDASAAKAVVRVGSMSLYNARATDALATERLRARTSGEGSRERRRRPRTTTTRDDAKYAAPAAEASERNRSTLRR